MYRQRVLFGLLAAADAAVLALDLPDFTALWLHLRAPGAWLGESGTDAALATVAAALLWCAAAWLALGLFAALAGGLPGLPGRVATALSRRLLPRAVAATLAGSAGLGVLVAPAVAGAASPPSPHPSTPPALPAPTWPADPPARASSQPPIPAPAHRPSAASLPVPGWPSDPAPTTPGRSRPRPVTSTVPIPTAPTGSATAPPPPHTAAHPPAAGGTRSAPPPPSQAVRVRVRQGDSLWLIAARRLGADPSQADIAAEWPRWYAANREVIGADPGLILPGQVLVEPSDEAHQ